MYSDWNYPEPCLCGDPFCVSCGPAQGYSREYAEPEEDDIALVLPHCEECGLTKADIESEARRHGLVDPMCCDMTEFYDDLRYAEI